MLILADNPNYSSTKNLLNTYSMKLSSYVQNANEKKMELISYLQVSYGLMEEPSKQRGNFNVVLGKD